MFVRMLTIVVAVGCLAVGQATADELLYRYECDVAPYEYDPEGEAGPWIVGDPCEDPCSESINEEHGYFVLTWPQGGDIVNYTYIAYDQGGPFLPETLWVEWRFRSNHPLGPNFYSCDGRFTVAFRDVYDLINMYGDAAISFSGDDGVSGLDIEEFHTYRFESPDGDAYTFSVDGLVFVDAIGSSAIGATYVQMRGLGGCDAFPNTTNEWDFVRFGTISSGESIVASDPPSGLLGVTEYPDLDRFTVTFDNPNYVYIDDITVTVTGGEVPVVTQTRRRENDGPETVQVVLDRPISIDETTTFTFDTGAVDNEIEYYYLPHIEPEIPTMSTWSLLTLGVLLLAAGAYVFTKRPSSAPVTTPRRR